MSRRRFAHSTSEPPRARLLTLVRFETPRRYELHTANELASLTRRDADIALRATRRPPPHLVGRHIGPLRLALFSARKGPIKRYAQVEGGEATWVAPDDALPDHPSVVWRKRHLLKVTPGYRVSSLLTVMEFVTQAWELDYCQSFWRTGAPILSS